MPVFAGGFFDFYGGYNFPSSAHVTVKNGSSSSEFHADFQRTTTESIRGGAWFNSKPWLGMGGDLSLIRARSRNMDVDMIPLTYMVLFRAPLFTSDEMPLGRVRPYCGVGIGVSWYTAVDAHTKSYDNNVSAWDVSLGFQVPVGARFMITPHWGIATEYRYTYNKIDVTAELLPPRSHLETTIHGHHLLLGSVWDF